MILLRGIRCRIVLLYSYILSSQIVLTVTMVVVPENGLKTKKRHFQSITIRDSCWIWKEEVAVIKDQTKTFKLISWVLKLLESSRRYGLPKLVKVNLLRSVQSETFFQCCPFFFWFSSAVRIFFAGRANDIRTTLKELSEHNSIKHILSSQEFRSPTKIYLVIPSSVISLGPLGSVAQHHSFTLRSNNSL